MNTAPKRPDAKDAEPSASRIEQMRKDWGDETREPEMPELTVGAHLVGYLLEIGPAMAGGTGPVSITHQEIRAWEQLSRVRLMPWEARLLRQLSIIYVGECHKAEKHDCPAPWTPDDMDATRDLPAATRSMRDSIRKLARV